MKVYIRSASCISSQNTFNATSFLDQPVEYAGTRLKCIEPDYKDIIDPKLIRRMGRIIKMSVAAGLACLKEAEIVTPDAIITGTAYGCLEDTGVFLKNMVEQDEEPLSPTAFVHSTHNTIGAQIALLLKCTRYNNTFVNGGASFENALIDALLLLLDNDCENVLVGGMDEITEISHTVLSRFNLYKRMPVSNFNLFKQGSKGTIAGEGSAFFLLANKPSEKNIAFLEGIGTFYKPTGPDEIEQQINSFLSSHFIKSNEIDLLVLGSNGDADNDQLYIPIEEKLFETTPSVNYKHLCGEYPTSTAFALWLASNIIKNGAIPAVLNPKRAIKKDIKKILIYNHYQNVHHSLILLSAC